MAIPSHPREGGVLERIKVLDLTDGIAGAITTMLLADQGATVTAIEPPAGNPTRAMSGGLVWARSKRSAVFDLDDEADLAAVRKLARGADVVIDSFRPGAAAARPRRGDALRRRPGARALLDHRVRTRQSAR